MENNVLQKHVEELAQRLGGEFEESFGLPVLKLKGTKITEALIAAKNFSGVPCDFLHDVTAVDYPERNEFEVVYHLTSLKGPQMLRIKAVVDRDNPVIDSAVKIWPGADFMERECFDLLGIKFAGHPELKRILLWDDFEGHPLRKDYVTESLEERKRLRVMQPGE
ncbi:MAG TPA: NADH-quinone oxidoreductase subunit C [Verrucomicrobiae bacterium]|nr:NADH-quinone oxidoreductase subunit C [Verrucomicrobiae bacterium]